MDVVTYTPTVKIDLPPDALEWLERALQWPEDLAAYDRSNQPINMAEILGNSTVI